MNIFSASHIAQTFGVLGIAGVIFAESGLLIGFFLPGDTLLIPAGILASQHKLNLYVLLPAVAIAAIAGYQLGYSIGEKAGPRVFTRRDGLLFRKDYVERTYHFVRRHGGRSMALARFIAVVRTIVPVMAGVGKMPKRRFFVYNVIGAIIWTFSLVLSSYWVGQRVNNVDRFIVPIVVVGVLTTAGGELWFVLRNASSRRQFFKGLREEFNWVFRRRR